MVQPTDTINQDLLQRPVHDLLDMIEVEHDIRVKKVKNKCKENGITRVYELEDLSDKMLKKCGINMGLKLKLFVKID